MKIAFGVDPGGLELRAGVLEHLRAMGHEVVEVGTTDQENVVPYMIVGRNVAEKVTGGECDRGVVMCGTGMGTVSYTHLDVYKRQRYRIYYFKKKVKNKAAMYTQNYENE